MSAAKRNVDIYDIDGTEMLGMKLHTRLYDDSKNIEILRVPGGWIYQTWVVGKDGTNITTCFVPES